MTAPRSILTYAAGAGLVLALGVAGVQTVRLANERAAHAGTKTTHAETLQRLATATARAATAAQRAQQAQQQAMAAIDFKHTQELSNALTENETRRAADRPGTGRLRIAAVCPGPSAAPSVPSAATAPSVDAAAAEIAPDARQLVWDLRAALITERTQLLALQEYARACSAAKEPNAIPNP
ncbi:MAG TPA: lysis system i-spanin subunit Rz [Burkholderiaceae bacterium]